jgi:hypothetical protein
MSAEHLEISEQRVTENGGCARVVFLHVVPLFLDGLKELLAAVRWKVRNAIYYISGRRTQRMRRRRWFSRTELVPRRVLHADCLPTHGALGAPLAPVGSNTITMLRGSIKPSKQVVQSRYCERFRLAAAHRIQHGSTEQLRGNENKHGETGTAGSNHRQSVRQTERVLTTRGCTGGGTRACSWSPGDGTRRRRRGSRSRTRKEVVVHLISSREHVPRRGHCRRRPRGRCCRRHRSRPGRRPPRRPPPTSASPSAPPPRPSSPPSLTLSFSLSDQKPLPRTIPATQASAAGGESGASVSSRYLQTYSVQGPSNSTAIAAKWYHC